MLRYGFFLGCQIQLSAFGVKSRQIGKNALETPVMVTTVAHLVTLKCYIVVTKIGDIMLEVSILRVIVEGGLCWGPLCMKPTLYDPNIDPKILYTAPTQ